MRLFELVKPYRALSIIGMCKNAGKTTVLNRLIRDWPKEGGVLALTSIGRDGERTDLVTNTHKPEIYVKEGALVATAEGLLRHCDVTMEIIDTTGIPTPLGRVVLVRALSDGAVQLGGPSMNDQLSMLNTMFFHHGAGMVVIDGAISRKSLCAPAVSEATILCTGASYSPSMAAAVEDTGYAAGLLTLEKSLMWNSVPESRVTLTDGRESLPAAGEGGLIEAVRRFDGIKGIFFKGALTDSVIRPLLTAQRRLDGIELTVEDASKLLIKRDAYQKLILKGADIRVFTKTRLLMVAVNPVSAYGTDFDRVSFKRAVEMAVNVPVINVMEDAI